MYTLRVSFKRCGTTHTLAISYISSLKTFCRQIRFLIRLACILINEETAEANLIAHMTERCMMIQKNVHLSMNITRNGNRATERAWSE